jgi:hypothetical protein
MGVRHLGGAVTEIAAGRNREEEIEVRRHLRMHADVDRLPLRVGDDALMRQRVREPRIARDREPFAQTFEAAEVEQPVLHQRTAERDAKLIALEFGQLAFVEEVA